VAEITTRRQGKMIQALFRILEAEPDGLQAKDAISRVEAALELTAFELSTRWAVSHRHRQLRRRGPSEQGASYGTPASLGITRSRRCARIPARCCTSATAQGRPTGGAARFVDELLARVRRAGHTGPIIIRADSGFENHKLMAALARRGVEFSIGVEQSKTIRALIEEIPEADWVTIAGYPDRGQAQIAETRLGDFRLIVRRTRLVGAQAQLWPDWRYHCFATNRTVPLLTADIDHHDHATIELVSRDLKDQALAHFPSGQMHANGAWTMIGALAHNLGRWSTLIGLPDQPVQTARARRRHRLQIPARLTRTPTPNHRRGAPAGTQPPPKITTNQLHPGPPRRSRRQSHQIHLTQPATRWIQAK
jgi:hypothetical protein